MPLANKQLVLTENDLSRLWGKVTKGAGENDCWGWTDKLSKAGYAYLGIKGKKILVHRLLYELIVGPIPEGQDLDHLCRNRACINPNHQQPVTRRVNLLRGETITAREASATHCPKGHPYDLLNTHFYKGNRMCRKCGILNRARRNKVKKEGII